MLLIVILLLAILMMIYLIQSNEKFEIEPNTIMGGYSGGGDLELEGPGDAAWSGY